MHTTTPAPHTPTPPATAKHNNTPRLRFAEFQEAVPTHPLSGIAEIVNEKIRVEAISSSSYVSTENLLPEFAGMAATGNLPPVISVTRFQPKDILISNIRPYLKKVWQADIHGGASNDVLVVRAKSHVDANYLAALLRSDHFIDYVMRGAKGVKMPRGEISMIREFPIPCPSDAEQQKIAACLTSLDTLITAQTQKLDTLKTHKKGLMQQLFPRAGETTPRLRFAEFRGEWEKRVFGEQGQFLPALTGKSGNDFDTGAAKFIPYMNVFANTFINKNDLRSVSVKQDENQTKVIDGDVFFTISSETPDEVGMSSVLLDHIDNCFLNSFCTLFRFSEGNKINPVFCGYLLRQPIVRNYFAKKAQGSTRFNLSKDVFRNLPVYIPSDLEQQKIAACLSSLDELITAQAQKVAALQTHKKGLMQQLFPAQAKASA